MTTLTRDGWGTPPPGVAYREIPDVAVDAEDLVYVLTRHPGAVLVFDADGNFLRSFGEDSLSDRPHAVTVRPDGLACVVDEPSQVVRIYDRSGAEIGQLGTVGVASDSGVDLSLPVPDWCTSVTRGAEPFNRPTKVGLAADGGLFVSDGYANARVHRFSARGDLVASWGEPGVGPGEFNLPHSVLALIDGRVAVADRENDRLQLFSPDGLFLEEWTDVRRPTSIAQAVDGTVYVGELAWRVGEVSRRRGTITEATPAAIAVLSRGGELLDRRTTVESTAGTVDLVAPHGLAFDSSGALYVAEVSYSFTRLDHDYTLHKIAA